MIRTRSALALAGGALSLLALAGCSSGGSDDTSSSAASSAGSPTASAAAGGDGGGPGGADFAAYRDCLAENGVTLPDFGANGGNGGTPPSGMPTGAPPSGMTPPSGAPSGDPNGGGGMRLPEGVDQATWDAAQQACASLAPQGGFAGGQPQPQAT